MRKRFLSSTFVLSILCVFNASAATIIWDVNMSGATIFGTHQTITGTITVDDSGGNHISAVNLTAVVRNGTSGSSIQTAIFTSIPTITPPGTLHGADEFDFDAVTPSSGAIGPNYYGLFLFDDGGGAQGFLDNAFTSTSLVSQNALITKCSTPTSCSSTVGYSGSLTAQVVPIPAAIWLLGSGLLCLAGLARKSE